LILPWLFVFLRVVARVTHGTRTSPVRQQFLFPHQKNKGSRKRFFVFNILFSTGSSTANAACPASIAASADANTVDLALTRVFPATLAHRSSEKCYRLPRKILT